MRTSGAAERNAAARDHRPASSSKSGRARRIGRDRARRRAPEHARGGGPPRRPLAARATGVAGRRHAIATASTASRTWAAASSASSPCRSLIDEDDDRHAVSGDQPRPGVRRGARGARGHEDGDHQRRTCSSRARCAPAAARQFEAAVAAGRPADGTIVARRRVARVPPARRRSATRRSTRSARSTSRRARRTRDAVQSLGVIAMGAIVLALVGSFLLARMVSEPIGRLSGVARVDGGVARRRIAAAAHRARAASSTRSPRRSTR